MKLSIVIPVLNEERTLKEQIRKVTHFLNNDPGCFSDTKIIIADNGSTDLTPVFGLELAEEFERVTYLRTPDPGVGNALKNAWGLSNSDLIGYMDLDLATDLSHLYEVERAFALDDVDFVNGSRLLKESKVIGRSRLRTFTSKSFNLLLRIVFNTKFTDGMCGFKFLRRCILPDLIFNGANSNDWFFSSELMIVAEKMNKKVLEIPISWTDDPNSKVKILNLSKQYIKSILKLKRIIWRLK